MPKRNTPPLNCFQMKCNRGACATYQRTFQVIRLSMISLPEHNAPIVSHDQCSFYCHYTEVLNQPNGTHGAHTTGEHVTTQKLPNTLLSRPGICIPANHRPTLTLHVYIA